MLTTTSFQQIHDIVRGDRGEHSTYRFVDFGPAWLVAVPLMLFLLAACSGGDPPEATGSSAADPSRASSTPASVDPANQPSLAILRAAAFTDEGTNEFDEAEFTLNLDA